MGNADNQLEITRLQRSTGLNKKKLLHEALKSLCSVTLTSLDDAGRQEYFRVVERGTK